MPIPKLRVVASSYVETADWWAELSPAGKKEYIAEHPDSKHAKEAIQEGVKVVHQNQQMIQKHEDKKKEEKKKAKTTSEGDPIDDKKGKPDPKKAAEHDADMKGEGEPEPDEDEIEEEKSPKGLTKDVMPPTAEDKAATAQYKDTLKKALKAKAIPKEDMELFDNGGTKPGSPKRKAIADHVKSAIPGIIDHLKGQGKEWKSGVNGFRKAITGQTLSAHDKEAMKAITKDIIITVGSVAVTGGLGHGMALALSHFGFDFMKDVALKSISHGVVEGKKKKTGDGESNHDTEAEPTHASVYDFDDPKSRRSDRAYAADNASDEKMMQSILEQLTDFIANGDIPDSHWEQAVKQLSKKHSRTKNLTKKEKATVMTIPKLRVLSEKDVAALSHPKKLKVLKNRNRPASGTRPAIRKAPVVRAKPAVKMGA